MLLQKRLSIRPHPPRGEIPRLDTSCPGSPNSEQVAGEAIIAYRIRAATESRFDIMSELGRAMTSRIKGSFPGKFMFDHCDDGSMLPSGRDQLAVASINALRHTYNQPSVLVIAGFAFLLWIHASNFRHVLMPRLAAWQRDVWSRFVAAQSFKLLRPWETVPPVERALSIKRDDETFVASILLAISPAIGSPISARDREILQSIADRRQSPSAS